MGHGRITGEVLRTGANLQMTYARQRRQGFSSAQVDHLQRSVQLAREHADGCTTADEVGQHLPGHRLRVGGNPFGHHAMVTGKDGDPQFVQAWPFTPLQRCQVNGQCLQPAQ